MSDGRVSIALTELQTGCFNAKRRKGAFLCTGGNGGPTPT